MEVKPQVTLSPEFVLIQYNKLKQEYDKILQENYDLKTKLNYEKNLREKAEYELQKIQEQKRKRRTKSELELARENDIEYNPLKSNGCKKATAAEYITSYTYYKKIVEYMDNRIKNSSKRYRLNHIRNKALILVGLNFGVRCGDLLDLKWKNILNEDLTFKNKITIIEDKTNKLNKLLLTEFIKQTLTDYINLLKENGYEINFNDYIFSNFQNNEHIALQNVWNYMKEIQEKLNLPFHFSTHAMRKTCVNVAIVVDKTKVNTDIISKAQLLLNHNSSDSTMHYLKVTDTILDTMREKVSDWLLGKTNIDELVLTFKDENENQLLEQVKKLLEEKM